MWDLLIIGGGPAGSIAAYTAARGGARVLLVDKAAFPRAKVCGCCINGGALDQLNAAGLGDLPDRCWAVPLRGIRLFAGGRSADLAVPGGAALSREVFDAALIRRAIDAGAHFLPRTAARLDALDPSARTLTLHELPPNPKSKIKNQKSPVRSRVVLAADGLGGRLLDTARGFESPPAGDSRMGASTTITRSPRCFEHGTIHMACGEGGYVGLVVLEDGRLDVAAAFDPGFVRESGGPGAAAAGVLRQAGGPVVEGLGDAPWRGTPLLTRRRERVAGERLLVIGDAAGYVEPFTGEGIAWALASGRAAAGVAVEAAASPEWDDRFAARWTRRHRHMLRRRQWSCRLITRLLRRPRLTRGAVALLNHMPGLAVPVVRSVNAPLRLDTRADAPYRTS